MENDNSAQIAPGFPLDRGPEQRQPLRGPRRRMLPTELPDHLPVRMLNEFVYCPRLFYLEWVESQFAHSSDTVEGALRHKKLERRVDPLPAPEAEAEKIHSRSVKLSSDRLGLLAVMDLVEGSGNCVTPVDYKKGAPREGADGPEAWPADIAQVSAQALILRDNGYECNEAVLYYSRTKQRVRVPIDEAQVAETLAQLAAARETAAAALIPPPLVDSPKCPRCSLVGICLPDETIATHRLADTAVPGTQLTLFADDPEADPRWSALDLQPEREIRRLVPARDDLRPLYVVGQGLSIGISSELVRVKDHGKVVQDVRLNEISQVNIFGNNQLTAAALQSLCRTEKPISYFSYGGWFYGTTQGIGLKNVFLRREQFRRADDPTFCLWLARSLIYTKIRNQRTILRRNHIEPPTRCLSAMRRLAEQAMRAEALDELLGIEGNAARLYFQEFGGMLKGEPGEDSEEFSFDFTNRNRRPPRDPVNALLSFAYSLLAKDLTAIANAIGFDPFIGFFHQPRFGRPALALDLMEEFRPLVADSAVLSAINTRMVTQSDFIQVAGAVALRPEARKAFLRAYEQRVDTLVTHPLFGYRVNYRRVMEIQARLVARLLTGEISSYPGFETR